MLEKIMQRLNEEVEKIEAEMPEKQMYLWGKYVEAAYLRAVFLQMISNEKNKSEQFMSDKDILDMLNSLWQERMEERSNK